MHVANVASMLNKLVNYARVFRCYSATGYTLMEPVVWGGE